jgi:L-iditol 2-dehydrogenase
MDAPSGALLEPLGVALHAVDLAHVQGGDVVSVHGTGPIGLLIVQSALNAGAPTVYATEPLQWRRELAARFGAVTIDPGGGDTVRDILDATGGRGVDAAIECGWGGDAATQAVNVAKPGGRVVLVGIPQDDRLEVKHSTARRKGLTILWARRMKHTYPRAISLVQEGTIDVTSLISHRFALDRTPEAFALNAAYSDNVIKAIIDVSPA